MKKNIWLLLKKLKRICEFSQIEKKWKNLVGGGEIWELKNKLNAGQVAMSITTRRLVFSGAKKKRC